MEPSNEAEALDRCRCTHLNHILVLPAVTTRYAQHPGRSQRRFDAETRIEGDDFGVSCGIGSIDTHVLA